MDVKELQITPEIENIEDKISKNKNMTLIEQGIKRLVDIVAGLIGVIK